jgi:hypothetical protein
VGTQRHQIGIDPQVQDTTKISTAELGRQLILERDIQPLQDQLATLGYRKQGPTPAHRHLSKEEKKSLLETKRRQIRESNEFALVFPAEAREARKLAGIEPLILIEM